MRLVYASRSNSRGRFGAPDPVVNSILTQARPHAVRDGVSSILYYSNGYFFQCLEGDRIAVERTFARIRDDLRHREARILRLRAIPERLLAAGVIHHVDSEQDVHDFLSQNGIEIFNPYLFTEKLIDGLLVFMSQLPAAQEPAARPVRPPVAASALAVADELTEAALAEKKAGFWSKVMAGLGLRNTA